MATRHIPQGAENNDSYEVNEDMTCADPEVIYYKQVVPDPPVEIDQSTPGEVGITSKTGGA
jgi:hypothetical protein